MYLLFSWFWHLLWHGECFFFSWFWPVPIHWIWQAGMLYFRSISSHLHFCGIFVIPYPCLFLSCPDLQLFCFASSASLRIGVYSFDLSGWAICGLISGCRNLKWHPNLNNEYSSAHCVMRMLIIWLIGYFVWVKRLVRREFVSMNRSFVIRLYVIKTLN